MATIWRRIPERILGIGSFERINRGANAGFSQDGTIFLTLITQNIIFFLTEN